MNKNNKGFTLVELLSVIVIMGILLLVAVPGVFGVSNNIKTNAYCKKVSDIEAAAKLYGQDFVDDIEERGFIQISVKTLIDNNMYRKENDDCELGNDNNPCVTDPRDYSSMDNDTITILKKEKRFSSYYNFKNDDIDLCEGKRVDDQFGEYEIQLEHNGATYVAQNSVKVKFGQIPNPIIPPKKEFLVNLDSNNGTYSYHDTQTVNFTFRGYYLTNARDTMYFDANGNGVKYYNHTTDRVLFAAWDTNSFVLPTLSRQGYNFIGWWDKQVGGNRIGKPGMKYTPAKNNITIYGQWAPIVTTVTLKGQGAYSPATDQKINVTYDQAMPVISVPKKQYTITYNYNGSTQTNSSVSPEASFVGYYGQTNGKGTKYYNANGTSAHLWNVASETAILYANWSTATTKLPTPNAREGYEFVGWYTAASGGTKVGNAGANYSFIGNKTLYAHWNINKYTITLNNQSATYAGTASVQVTYAASLPSITKPTKNGYTFGGYYTSTNGGGTQYYNSNGVGVRNYTTTSDITLYGYWIPNKYTITLNNQDATYAGTTSIQATYAASLPSITKPTKNGYTFGGYYTNTGGRGTQYINDSGTSARILDLTSNATLYAKWIKTNITKGDYVYDYGSVHNWKVLSTSKSDVTLVSQYVIGSWTESREDGNTEVNRINAAASAYNIKNSKGNVIAKASNITKSQIESYIGYGFGLNSNITNSDIKVGTYWIATNCLERYQGPYWIDDGGTIHYAYPYDGYVDTFGLRLVVNTTTSHLSWDSVNNRWIIV